MKTFVKWFARGAELVAATMMAAMFLTFIVQIAVRYSARLDWLVAAVPVLNPAYYDWTLEFCLALWVWIVFWGGALVVRERDHVTFDILYMHVKPKVRRWLSIVIGLVICISFLWSLLPTWENFYILRLKRTASLGYLLGDWVRIRDIYSIYIAFLIIVAARYAWYAWNAFRHGAAVDRQSNNEINQ